MNKDLKYFIGLLSSKGARAVINLSFVALLARVLGPNGLGEWAMVVAAGTLLHSILLNWMHAPTVRFGREEWQRERTVKASWSARLPYLLIGFIITFSLIILDPGQWLERYYHLSDNLKPAAILVSLWLWLSMETQNFLQLRQAMKRLALVPVLVDGTPVLILFIIFVSAIRGLPIHILITGLLSLSVLLWSIALSWELKQLKVRWTLPGIENLRKTFVYSWPLIPGFMLGYISVWGNQLLLRYFFTTHEVGLFQAAYQVLVLLLGIATPLNTVLLPKLIDKEMLSSDNAREFLIAAGPTIVALGLFLLVPVVTFAPFCFKILMGSKFAGATSVFVVLCIAVPGSIIMSFYAVFFSLQGRLWRSTVIYGGVISSLNILIAIILIPKIGIIGSAIGIGVSSLVAQSFYLFDQQRYYRVSLTKSFVLFGAVLSFALLQALVGNDLLARFVLCLLSLMALIFLTRKYSLLDRDWVLRILSGKLSGLGNLLVRVTNP